MRKITRNRVVRMSAGLFLAAVFFLGGCLLFRPAPEPGLPISYRLKDPAQVSINIYDGQGQIVRELMRAIPRPAGGNREFWDGRDGDGKPVPPGVYAWKLLATPGLTAEYLMCLGNNYPNGTNDWRHRAPGSHGGPTAVAADGGGIYVAASGTENIENYLLKMDRAATNRLWSALQHEAWVGGIALAGANGTLFVLGGNRNVWRYDAAAGTLLPGFQPVVNGEKPADLAARGGQLAVCYTGAGIVQWLDPKTGAALDSAGVPAASALAVSSNGAVFVIGGNDVVRVSRSEKQPVAVLTNLVSPLRLDVDDTSGDLLVAEGGESRQVKRFSGTGRLLAAYGRVGGRLDGLYEPRDFRDVSDIACDGAGGFLVSEPNAAPRRAAHFDKDGKLIQEWYGGQTWGPWVFPEPDQPQAVWMNSSQTDMMRLEVDYTARTWRVHSTYRYAGLANDLAPGNQNAMVWEGRAHNGELYLCQAKYNFHVLRVDRKNWRLLPATVCDHNIEHNLRSKPRIIQDWRGKNNAYQWNDANGDGAPQREEIVFYPTGVYRSFASVGENMEWLFNGGDGVRAFAVTGWTPCGAPVYGEFPKSKLAARYPPRVTNIEPRWGSHIGRDPKSGALYGAFNDRMPDWGQSKDSFLVKWNSTGKQEWTVGRLGPGAGQVWRPFRRWAGFTHDCPVFAGFSYEWPQDGPTATYVWDADGLWVGGLFDHPDLTVADEHLYSLGAEALAATVWTDHRSGDVRLFGCWLNEARVYRIGGWEGWQRASGHVKVKAGGEGSVPSGFTNGGTRIAPVPSRFEPAWLELPVSNGTGLKAEYFHTFQYNPSSLVTSRVDAAVDFVWGVQETTNYAPPFGKSSFSVRWTGRIVPRTTGLYAFRSDGSTCVGRIWVDGRMFTTPTQDRVKGRYRVALEAGHAYEIRIEYSMYLVHPTICHGIRLQWLPPDRAQWEPAPTSQIFPAP